MTPKQHEEILRAAMRLNGAKGGKMRAKRMTKAQRSRAAQRASRARWDRKPLRRSA